MVNQRGTTVLLATHDREMIQRVGGRVLTLDRGQLATDREVLGSEKPELRLADEEDLDEEGGRALGSAKDVKDGKDFKDIGDVRDEEGGGEEREGEEVLEEKVL